MRNKVLAAALATVMVVPAAAQMTPPAARPPRGGETATWLTVADAGTVTGVPTNRPIRIRLTYNPSTGIVWEPTYKVNVKSVQMVESVPSAGTPGPNQGGMMVGGEETAIFRVMLEKPGWALVTFQQKDREGKVVGRGYTFRLTGT